MVNYKQILVALLCIASLNSTNGMLEEDKPASKEVCATNQINTLFDFETDSVVIQSGKTILTNEDYNDNAPLLAAYAHFFIDFKMYKEGQEHLYTMYMEKCALEKGMNDDPDCAAEFFFNYLDLDWQKNAKELKKTDDIDKAKKDLYEALDQNFNDKADKANVAVYKKWMLSRDFINTRFQVDLICKLLGHRKLIEQETEKVLELLKKYSF